jgi:uncharacterized 2Fe-2S/4Fe-4S cluster protein (DUF4445 family)
MTQVELGIMGRTLEANPGESLLEALRNGGVGVVSPCGGIGKCGKCRVRLVHGELSEPTAVEQEMLSEEELMEDLRLACQCEPVADVQVEIPVDSLELSQRLQLEGEDRDIRLNPPVSSVAVEMSPPTSEDLASDGTRLEEALVAAGHPPAAPTRVVLTDFSDRIRGLAWRARIAVRDEEVISVLPADSPVVGLAVDIGTTKMAAYLIDLETGQCLSKSGVMNPQVEYGDDVLSRIAYANEHMDGRERLQEVVIEGLAALVQRLCRDAEVTVEAVVEAVVVGNTAMHHLFARLPVRQLGFMPYVPAVSSAMAFRVGEVGLELAPGTSVYLPPNVAGFVGADHVAMLLATRAYQADRPTIALDIGTNTEISLAADGRLLSCSCASGPAFEGAHIRDGMRAAPGAIEQVVLRDGRAHVVTVGGKPPVGLCGSGVLDAVAELFAHGVLESSGQFADGSGPCEEEACRSFTLVPAGLTGHDRSIGIVLDDVREIQLAKGAIRAGIEILLREAGLEYADVEEFVVAGAFGTYLNVRSAVCIGMFPPVPIDRFRQVGNAAGMGAVRLLLSVDEREEAERIADLVEYVELTVHPAFRRVFAHALRLGDYAGP